MSQLPVNAIMGFFFFKWKENISVLNICSYRKQIYMRCCLISAPVKVRVKNVHFRSVGYVPLALLRVLFLLQINYCFF